MSEAVRLAVDIVFRPWRAMARLASPASLPAALLLYGAYLAASTAFSLWKPEDFPRIEAEALGGGPGTNEGLLHWLGVEAYNALLLAVFAALLVWFLWALAGKRLWLRVFLSGALTLVPIALSLAYLTPAPGTPTWPLALVWLALAAGLAPGLRRADKGLWRPLASLLLASNAVYLAALPVLAASVLLRSDDLYLTTARGMALWLFFLEIYGVSRVSGIQLGRAACALVFAVVCQSCFAHAIFRLGLMSKDVLKSLLSL